MKKSVHRLIAAAIILALITSTADARAAQTGDLVRGHWAEKTLTRAISDGLIVGGGEDIRPDALITGAEMVTILCRVMSAEKTADLYWVTDVRKDDWFYTQAAQAMALGIVAPANGRLRLEMPATRGRAFEALAEAFQLIGAKPDFSRLSEFSDGSELTGRYKMAAAALVAGGYVKGDGNALNIDSDISLAEFLTILYRIIPNYGKPGGTTGSVQGGTLISGDSAVNGATYSDNVYFDCSASSVSLQNVEAPCAVVRGDSLRTLSVSSSRIGRLVLAASGGDINFFSSSSSSLGAFVIGDGSGTVTLSGGIPTLEITGDNRNVVITSSVQTLLISGSGCRITVYPYTSVGSVQILGAAAGNTITLNGNCGECSIYGENTIIDGSGAISELIDYSSGGEVGVNVISASEVKSFGLGGANLKVDAPYTLPSYKSLNASVEISAPGGINPCVGLWYLDDVVVSRTEVTPDTTALELIHRVENSGDVPVTVTLSFALYYEDSAGGYQEKRVYRNIVVENPDKFDIQEVLSLVKTGYQGDYTLEWAETHDYDEDLKTAWVNFKGYSSKTDYLIWISIAYQRVNVFTGSAGNWTLDRTFLVGTGAPGSGTPKGVYSVFAKSAAGWTTSTYTVKPVVNFYSGYAFHSRLYYPGTTTVVDARIGFPISHGCIRMYSEDVQWIYDTIPIGTTVVSY